MGRPFSHFAHGGSAELGRAGACPGCSPPLSLGWPDIVALVPAITFGPSQTSQQRDAVATAPRQITAGAMPPRDVVLVDDEAGQCTAVRTLRTNVVSRHVPVLPPSTQVTWPLAIVGARRRPAQHRAIANRIGLLSLQGFEGTLTNDDDAGRAAIRSRETARFPWRAENVARRYQRRPACAGVPRRAVAGARAPHDPCVGAVYHRPSRTDEEEVAAGEAAQARQEVYHPPERAAWPRVRRPVATRVECWVRFRSRTVLGPRCAVLAARIRGKSWWR